MYSFGSLYSAVVSASFVAGFCFPGTVKQRRNWKNFVVQAYTVFSTVPLLYVVVCNLIVLYYFGLFDIKFHGINTIMFVTVFDTYYYLYRRQEFDRLLENFDAVADNILRSRLIRNSDVAFILNKAKRFNSVAKRFMVLVVLQNASAPVYLMSVHFLYSQNLVFINVPYSLSSLPLLFVTWILHMFTGLFASSKIVCFWGVIFLFLYHIVFYLKALRESFYDSFEVSTTSNEHYHLVKNNSEFLAGTNEIAPVDSSKSVSQDLSHCGGIITTHDNYVINKLRDWIQLHQSVMGLISQFNKLYSPLLLVHLLNFYANGLSSVFAATVQKEGMSFSLTMLSYVGVELLAFLAICSFGSELTYQSRRVFENGYATAQLSWDKAASSCGLIIGEVVNKPVIVSVFGSEYFNLQLQAFVMIVQSMVSFYIALSQMAKLNNSYNNVQ